MLGNEAPDRISLPNADKTLLAVVGRQKITLTGAGRKRGLDFQEAFIDAIFPPGSQEAIVVFPGALEIWDVGEGRRIRRIPYQVIEDINKVHACCLSCSKHGDVVGLLLLGKPELLLSTECKANMIVADTRRGKVRCVDEFTHKFFHSERPLIAYVDLWKGFLLAHHHELFFVRNDGQKRRIEVGPVPITCLCVSSQGAYAYLGRADTTITRIPLASLLHSEKGAFGK
jgi:hypothetical protein